MRPMRLGELVPVVGGALHGEARFERVDTDSRDTGPGGLFVALRGTRFDGNHYVPEAVERKASAVLVSKTPTVAVDYLCVEDTAAALGLIAALNRRLYSHPMVAITGSTGKTTCKEMVASILSLKLATYATPANRNNEIGVPLCLLALEPRHRAAVLELAARGRGQIAQLAEWVCPDVALITNAQTAHIEAFGDERTIVETKGELLAYLQDRGTAVLARDSEHFEYWCGRCPPGTRVLSFGNAPGADVYVEERAQKLYLHVPRQTVPLGLNLLGRANRLNAAAAAAVAVALDIDAETIADGLGRVTAPRGRLSVVCDDPLVLDDSYNANPHSVREAIDVLASHGGSRLLVLGDMADLGERSEFYHREVGDYARAKGIESFWCCGRWSHYSALAYGARARHYTDREQLIKSLDSAVHADVILVKGSRVAGMDLVVQQILRVCAADTDRRT